MRVRSFQILVLLGLAACAASVRAADIRVIDSTELGARALILEGQIEREDGRRLPVILDQLARTESDIVKVLILNSPGGVVASAHEIGRYLKSNGLGTAVLPNGRCDSACADLFFAGYDQTLRQPRRIAFAGGRIGVHQAFPVPDPPGKDKFTLAEVSAVYGQIQRELGIRLRYLQQMEVGADILARMLETSPKGIYPLPVALLSQSGVILAARVPGGWKLEGVPEGMALFPTAVQRTQFARPVEPASLAARQHPPSRSPGEDRPTENWAPSLVQPRVDSLRAYFKLSATDKQTVLDSAARAIEARRFGTALQLLRDLWPEDPNAHYLRSLAQMGQGRSEAAGLVELLQAASLDHPRALGLAASLTFLGRGTPKSDDKAFDLWKRGAALGDRDSQWELASRFYYLDLGGKGDLTEARRLFETLAAQGMPQAINALGQMNETGRGVPVNPAAAVGLYLRAAQMGDALAMANLGRLFKTGTGLPKDPRQFLLWTGRSAETGHPPALYALGKSYLDGDAGVEDMDRGVNLLKRAEARDSGAAMALLADLYRAGRGVAASPVLAQVHRLMAEARGQQIPDRGSVLIDAILGEADRRKAAKLVAVIASDFVPRVKE